MREQETDQTSATPTAVDRGPRKELHQDRLPVRAFDPHFGNLLGDTGRDHSDFDERMWARTT